MLPSSSLRNLCTTPFRVRLFLHISRIIPAPLVVRAVPCTFVRCIRRQTSSFQCAFPLGIPRNTPAPVLPMFFYILGISHVPCTTHIFRGYVHVRVSAHILIPPPSNPPTMSDFSPTERAIFETEIVIQNALAFFAHVFLKHVAPYYARLSIHSFHFWFLSCQRACCTRRIRFGCSIRSMSASISPFGRFGRLRIISAHSAYSEQCAWHSRQRLWHL